MANYFEDTSWVQLPEVSSGKISDIIETGHMYLDRDCQVLVTAGEFETDHYLLQTIQDIVHEALNYRLLHSDQDEFQELTLQFRESFIKMDLNREIILIWKYVAFDSLFP